MQLKYIAMPYRGLLICGLLSIGSACSESPANRYERPLEGDASSAVIDCQGADDGESCGDQRHCVAEQCQVNRCGDGIRAGSEACDDGNAQIGDGCTPSCRLESSCGDHCDRDAGLDAGPTPATDCPHVLHLTATPERVWVGENITLTAEVEGEGQFQWITGSDRDAGVESGGFFGPPTEPNANFSCQALGTESERILSLFVVKPGCPVSTQTITVGCAPLVVDAGGFGQDDAAVDAAADASASDAGSDAGQFRSPECEACVRGACVAYQEFDFVTPCFEAGVSPQYSQQCEDLFFCALASPDRCAYNKIRGAIGCFCGETVLVDDCQKGTVQGNCIPQFYAATGCGNSDYGCVLNRYQDLTRPVGTAVFAIECMNDQCSEVCK